MPSLYVPKDGGKLSVPKRAPKKRKVAIKVVNRKISRELKRQARQRLGTAHDCEPYARGNGHVYQYL